MKQRTEADRGSPLKTYCAILALLTAVAGFLYFKNTSTLDDYRAANAQADEWLQADPNERDGRGRPVQLAALAIETQRMIEGYAATIGGPEAEGDGDYISRHVMRLAAEEAEVDLFRAGKETRDRNKGRGYLDVSAEDVYQETTLENLIALMFNVEELGRYRVTEVRWQLRDENKNPTPPFTLIQKPSVRVAFRRPISTEAN